jgi:CubicO group peptidase (beta-lactamase class C family)
MKHPTPELEEFLHNLLEKHGVPGLALAKIEDSKLAWFAGFGVATRGTPVKSDTIFETASLSKPVVAFAALKLCEVRALSLDAPLETYLNQGLDARITVRHVLSHTSGLPNWLPNSGDAQPHFLPGLRFSYSGIGYGLLQRAMENVTGFPLEEFFSAQVFAPFNMRNSSFVWRDDFSDRFAVGHDAHGQPVKKEFPMKAHAASSLLSTAEDLGQFIVALLNSDTLATVLEPQTPVNDTVPWKDNWDRTEVEEFQDVNWGLGLGLERASSGSFFWQWGDNDCFKALMIASKETGEGFVALTNSANGDRLWRDLTAELLSGEHPMLDWLERLYGL